MRRGKPRVSPKKAGSEMQKTHGALRGSHRAAMPAWSDRSSGSESDSASSEGSFTGETTACSEYPVPACQTVAEARSWKIVFGVESFHFVQESLGAEGLLRSEGHHALEESAGSSEVENRHEESRSAAASLP